RDLESPRAERRQRGADAGHDAERQGGNQLWSDRGGVEGDTCSVEEDLRATPSKLVQRLGRSPAQVVRAVVARLRRKSRTYELVLALRAVTAQHRREPRHGIDQLDEGSEAVDRDRVEISERVPVNGLPTRTARSASERSTPPTVPSAATYAGADPGARLERPRAPGFDAQATTRSKSPGRGLAPVVVRAPTPSRLSVAAMSVPTA